MMMPIEDAVALLCLGALIVLVLLERTLGRWLDKKADEEREQRRLHRGTALNDEHRPCYPQANNKER